MLFIDNHRYYPAQTINPDISPKFAALASRALYPRPLAPQERRNPHEIFGP